MIFYLKNWDSGDFTVVLLGKKLTKINFILIFIFQSKCTRFVPQTNAIIFLSICMIIKYVQKCGLLKTLNAKSIR